MDSATQSETSTKELATNVSAKSKGKKKTKGSTPAKSKREVAQTEGEVNKADAQTVKFTDILGRVVSLMTQSPFHRFSFMSDLDWLVGPALLYGQFDMWEEDGVPVAYVSWAFVTEEIEQRFAQGGVKLTPDEWKCGTSPWIVDVVIPGKDPKPYLQHVVKKHFADTGVKTIAPDENGNRRVIMLKASQNEKDGSE